MKMKILGTAAAAALLGLSGLTYAQSGGMSSNPGDRAGSPVDQNRPGQASTESGANAGTASTGTGTTSTTHCDAMTGDAKTRCLRDARASSGSSGDVPVTRNPGQSGPGAVDRDSRNPSAPGVGTRSDGSTR